MIGKHVGSFLLKSDDPLIIPADRVATVRCRDNLMHAMTLLSTIGFNAIPVLDQNSSLRGSISLNRIINSIKTIEAYEWDTLTSRLVESVMDPCHGFVNVNADLENVLHGLVDHNYLAVVDEKGGFVGIVTRGAIMKQVNRLVHQFESVYKVQPRSEGEAYEMISFRRLAAAAVNT
jgi:predicted transcriptional regulator